MKKSFTLLEFILTMTLIAVLYTLFIPKYKINKLNELSSRINLYLAYLRYQAMIDNKYDSNKMWFKKRWTLKFFNCNKDVGGIYFVIYSDENKKGHPNQNESMKDALTNKYIYSSHTCKENEYNSKYVLLTKNYDLKEVKVSCNKTQGLGQISFGVDGRVYANISKNKDYEIRKPCFIDFVDNNGREKTLKIEPKTGYVSTNPKI